MIEVTVYTPIVKGKSVPLTKLVRSPRLWKQIPTNFEKVKIEFVFPKRPFLFWADLQCGEMFEFPRGYGIAYIDRDECRDYARVLYAPIPFNILVGYLIKGYRWTKYGFAFRNPIRRRK